MDKKLMTKEVKIYTPVMTLSSLSGVWKVGQTHAKKIQLDNYLHHIQK